MKTPEGQEAFESGVRDMVESQLISFKENGLAIGGGVPLDKVLKGLSINLGTGL